MSCPVCGATMQNLGSPERRVFWCPTCGTLKYASGDFESVEMPARVRHIIAAAKFSPGETQSATVEARFRVHQEGGEAARVEQTVFRSNRLPPREAEA
jgi:Zn-finger nucleic acid-binding protein